ncbi:MAG: hypothetical protein HC802_09750, partial [Caldilineaceae bacterium]|nr:hypothetical protein [Caldilineaceae bacterium]
LTVRVERLLIDSVIPNDYYKQRKTFLCHIVSGQAAPGYEPEEDAASVYAIIDAAWFDLRSEERWEASIFQQSHRLSHVATDSSRYI